jgi:ribosome maturation factor RimP
MIVPETISAIIAPKLEELDLFEVEVSVKPGNRISVAIDKNTGITLDECTLISRHIFAHLDREVEDYELEVSSPGLTSPLRVPRQYMRRIGRSFKLLLHNGEQFEGTLKAAGDETIEIERWVKINKKEKKLEELTLSYSEIKQAKLIVKF